MFYICPRNDILPTYLHAMIDCIRKNATIPPPPPPLSPTHLQKAKEKKKQLLPINACMLCVLLFSLKPEKIRILQSTPWVKEKITDIFPFLPFCL